eukprot:gene28377-35165_t
MALHRWVESVRLEGGGWNEYRASLGQEAFAGWAVGDEGLILRSYDSGASWIIQEGCGPGNYRGLATQANSDSTRNPEKMYAVGQSFKGVCLTIDAGDIYTLEGATATEGRDLYSVVWRTSDTLDLISCGDTGQLLSYQ